MLAGTAGGPVTLKDGVLPVLCASVKAGGPVLTLPEVARPAAGSVNPPPVMLIEAPRPEGGRKLLEVESDGASEEGIAGGEVAAAPAAADVLPFVLFVGLDDVAGSAGGPDAPFGEEGVEFVGEVDVVIIGPLGFTGTCGGA